MVSEADAGERPGTARPRAVGAGTSASQRTSSRGTCVTTSWGKALVKATHAGTHDPENRDWNADLAGECRRPLLPGAWFATRAHLAAADDVSGQQPAARPAKPSAAPGV